MMKKILLACCLIAVSSITTMAQNAANIDPKLMLVSKINEFDAFLTRNKADEAQKAYNEIAAMLSQHMAAIHQEYNAASGAAKETLKKKIDLEQSIYSDTKMMSVDMKKNQKDMVAKFNKFVENY